MKNKKGFTLIELLAVIVILAVIMVIAVPKILNIVENSRKKSFESSYKMLGDGIKTQIAASNLTNSSFTKTGECYVFDLPDKNENASNLNVKNKEQFTGIIQYCNGNLIYENVSDGKYIVSTDGGKEIVSKIGEEEVDNDNYLVKAPQDSNTPFLNGPLKKNEIESIKFETSKKVPSDALGNFDVSNESNGSIMAWYKDEDNNGLYELYIGQNGGVKANLDSSCLFYGLVKVTSLDLSNLNTSKVTNMDSMFSNCSSLTNLDLSSFDTSNVTDMGSMFYVCSSLTSIDLSNFDTSNVTDMGGMFNYCPSLTSLDLSSFDTSNVTNMDGMFACLNLTSLDLDNFDTSNVTDMDSMFGHCFSLTTNITISNPNTASYYSMFFNAATGSNAKITVNYTSSTSSLVDNMISTKSSNSNVVKGKLVE